MGRRAKPAKAKVQGKLPFAKTPKSDDARVGELEKRLAEALEQQIATADILRVIASSPSDVHPVFDVVVQSAVQLCHGNFGAVYRYDGGLIHLAAHHNITGEALEYLRRPRPPGRVILERRIVQVADFESDPEVSEEARIGARLRGSRSNVAVPMMRGGDCLGYVVVGKCEPGYFPERQVALLQTFADQAVIAIENVRLFNETREALEQQMATSDILRIIASSPTDLQPVFTAIVERAVRLCGARFGRVYRYDGERIHMVAGYGLGAEGLAEVQRVFPRPASGDTIAGRVILTRQPALVRNIEHEQGVPAVSRRMIEALETRSQATVPMLRMEQPIGAMTLGWAEPEAFDEQQITLLRTFADQAVIAIENVRLFTELQEKNRALTQAHEQVTEALDQQTATSEILRTIAQAQTDAQPVFDTIVQSAARLLRAAIAGVFVTDGRTVYHSANYGSSPEALAGARARYPRPVDEETMPGLAILTRAVVHVPDSEEASASEHVRQVGRLLGFRSVVSVPMLREDEAVGAIAVSRREPGRFSDAEVELLKTFADQAVIAVENVRLFKQLEARTSALTRSVEQLTALGEVGRAVSSTLDLETVLTTIVSRAVQLSELDGGVVFEYDEAPEEFVHRVATETGGALAEARRATRVRKGEGVVGRTAITLEPAQVPDITVPGAYESRLRENLITSGVRAVLAVPMLSEDRLVGCLVVSRNQPGEFTTETIDLLRTFATQSALAIQNARLFLEIADKSQQLEAASRHKSEFLANMSHELRTPLNAVIGFSEVLLQRMFGELNAKQDEYLKDIYASGQHLLSLINDILDLSKIEAGRMELTPALFHLPSALENAVTLVRERAARHGITLQIDVDLRLGEMVGDERKVKQVVLNLLSNAVKFTPEGGRISLKVGPRDGTVEIAVTDTGVGIAPEDQAAIFEEFRQVGSDETRKQEGTGLGLTLAKKFVELHGGRIWVESAPGQGSTFTFTLPVS